MTGPHTLWGYHQVMETREPEFDHATGTLSITGPVPPDFTMTVHGVDGSVRTVAADEINAEFAHAWGL